MNKKWIFGTLGICLLLIIVPVFYKIYQNHEKRLLLVSEKRIIEAAIDCYNLNQCENSKITLKELHEKNFLKNQEVHPITHIPYHENSYVEYYENDYHFVEEK